MKFELIGKVTSRTCRKFKNRDGMMQDIYQLEIEENGMYRNPFLVTSKDASLFGQKDGPCGIGKFVKVTGFGDGFMKEIELKDGSGKLKKYDVYLKIRTIEPVEIEIHPPENSGTDDGIAPDMPF